MASSLLWYPSRAELLSVGQPDLAFLLTQEVMRGIRGVETQVRRPEQILGEHASLYLCVPSPRVSLRLPSGLMCP